MKNKSKMILGIAISLILLSLISVNAMVNYCGDGNCDVGGIYGGYNESNPLNSYYCPSDCGTRVNAEWCEDTYNLRTDCPTCPTCNYPTCECTTSRIPTDNLRGWCVSNGYSNLGCQNYGASASGDATNNSYIYWVIFLIIGFIIGYFYQKNKKRKKR